MARGARRGELWNIYRQHYGPNGDPLILVAQGASRDFNPTLPERVVQRALERDPAAAEWGILGAVLLDRPISFHNRGETTARYAVVIVSEPGRGR